MSDDRDPGVDPRPERWLVPTDDDDHVDVPTTSGGRHSSPEPEPEQGGSTETRAADPVAEPVTGPVWTGSHPAAQQPPAAAWSESDAPLGGAAAPSTGAAGISSDNAAAPSGNPAAPADHQAGPADTPTGSTAGWQSADTAAQSPWPSADTSEQSPWQSDDTSVQPQWQSGDIGPADDPSGQSSSPEQSGWQSDDAHTQLIEPVPAEPVGETSILAAVAADRTADDGLRSPPTGRAATRAAAREASRQHSGGSRVRTVVRGIGQTFITLGVIVLLFVVYEVYITDIFSAAKQKEATAALDERWVQGDVEQQTEVVTVTDPNELVVDPASRGRSYEVLDGEGFAKISIPAFGPDYHYTIISGTNPDELTTGPGHYPDSQYPGEQGNFAIAGHRVSKGSPFNALDQLSSCDAIIIETQDDWFVYRVLPMENELAGWDPAARANCAGVEAPTGQYADVLGREITLPTDYAQVLPVPHVDSYTVPTDAQRLITLTTCHPQFSDAERMIIHGTLVKTYTKSAGFIPPEMTEG